MAVISDILIVAGIFWIVCGYFSYMQTVKMNKLMRSLGEKAERLFNGRNAGFMRTRRICFAATTDQGIVVEAKMLRTALLVLPSKILDLNELEGKNLNSLNPDQLGLDPLATKAVHGLLKDFQRRK